MAVESSLRPTATLATAALGLLLLAACAGMDPKSPAAADQIGNLQAPLRGVGSAATGKIVVVDYPDGIVLTLDISNLRQGIYRLAFHANPVCNSPRGESAGPPWGPPNSTTAPGELIPEVYAGQAGQVSFSARIPGVHIDREPSLRGRSIVLHEGPFVDSPLPGMPNNYIACGVFEDLPRGFFNP
jgi:Cu/Zn superoxide dismutase